MLITRTEFKSKNYFYYYYYFFIFNKFTHYFCNASERTYDAKLTRWSDRIITQSIKRTFHNIY